MITLENPKLRKLIRNFVLEVLIYSALVVVYFFLVLQFLAEPLGALFVSNLILYAFVALALIVVQGAVLEFFTSLLISRLGLESLE